MSTDIGGGDSVRPHPADSAEPRADHAAYLASWLGALKNDPRLLWTAASQADKAVDYLNEHSEKV